MTARTFNRKVQVACNKIREGRSYAYHYKASRKAGNDHAAADEWALDAASIAARNTPQG